MKKINIWIAIVFLMSSYQVLNASEIGWTLNEINEIRMDGNDLSYWSVDMRSEAFNQFLRAVKKSDQRLVNQDTCRESVFEPDSQLVYELYWGLDIYSDPCQTIDQDRDFIATGGGASSGKL